MFGINIFEGNKQVGKCFFFVFSCRFFHYVFWRCVSFGLYRTTFIRIHVSSGIPCTHSAMYIVWRSMYSFGYVHRLAFHVLIRLCTSSGIPCAHSAMYIVWHSMYPFGYVHCWVTIYTRRPHYIVSCLKIDCIWQNYIILGLYVLLSFNVQLYEPLLTTIGPFL